MIAKNKTVYFLIDCSGSMAGNRADAVNIAMQKVVAEVLPDLRNMNKMDLNLKFVVYGFSDNNGEKVFPIVPKTSLENFNRWDPIDVSKFRGGTPTGAAIEWVIEDLEKGSLKGDIETNAVAPAIILISDGEPTGTDPTYEEALARAEKDNPKYSEKFRRALRVALGINVEDAGRESLKKFGKLSTSITAEGVEPYYDCSEEYKDKLVDILKSVTLHLSTPPRL